MWDTSKVIKKGDYYYAKIPEHPNATKNGYVLQHRAIMENMVGRLLTKDDEVHHIDGNRYNKMRTAGSFHGTGEDLIKESYAKSMLSGKCYEAVVRAHEAVEKAREENGNLEEQRGK